MPKIKVLIYDDNEDRRDSLSALLLLADEMQCVGDFPDCSNVQEQIRTLQPHVVLMDIDMPNVNGIEGLKIIRLHFPEVKVLMQTVFEQNEKIFDSINLYFHFRKAIFHNLFGIGTWLHHSHSKQRSCANLFPEISAK